MNSKHRHTEQPGKIASEERPSSQLQSQHRSVNYVTEHGGLRKKTAPIGDSNSFKREHEALGQEHGSDPLIGSSGDRRKG